VGIVEKMESQEFLKGTLRKKKKTKTYTRGSRNTTIKREGVLNKAATSAVIAAPRSKQASRNWSGSPTCTASPSQTVTELNPTAPTTLSSPPPLRRQTKGRDPCRTLDPESQSEDCNLLVGGRLDLKASNRLQRVCVGAERWAGRAGVRPASAGRAPGGDHGRRREGGANHRARL
jgi:hypothetical protein